MAKMEVIMKKNYLLLMGLLLIAPCVFASDDESDDEETPIVTRQDVGMFADGFKAGAISLNNLSRLFGLFGQKMKEIAENTPENAHAALDAAKQVAQGAASQVANFGDNSTSLLERGTRALKIIDKTNNIIHYVINKADRMNKNILTLKSTFEYLQRFLPKNQFSSNNTLNNSSDFDEILFYPSYFQKEPFIDIINANTPNFLPDDERTFVDIMTNGERTHSKISGLFLYGSSGTGKTYGAKALAHKIGAHYIDESVSTIFAAIYIGESSKKIKNIFAAARNLVRKSTSTHPIKVVLLLDEIDNLVTKRVTDNAIIGSLGGSARIDHNNAVTSFMDEFNSPHNNGILVIGTTNNYSKQHFDQAIISRFTYGAIEFKKITKKERLDYIVFCVEKNIALTLKNESQIINAKTFSMLWYMKKAKTILNTWYPDLDNSPLSLFNNLTYTDTNDLRDTEPLVVKMINNKNIRIKLINRLNKLRNLESPLQNSIKIFRKWPLYELCEKNIITRLFNKMGITKDDFPLVIYALSSATSMIAVKKILQRISANAHSALTIGNYVVLNPEDKTNIQKTLCAIIAIFSIIKLTLLAEKISQPTIDIEKIIAHYSNPEFAITQEDIDAHFGDNLEEDNSEESSEEYDDNDSNSSSNNSSETTLYC